MNNINHEKNKKSIKKYHNLLDGILPFTEKPSNQPFNQKGEGGINEIQASDLFSYFTANIIKEEVTFTR